MTENYLEYLKQKLINKFDQKESHIEYYDKYDQLIYYLYTSEIEDVIEEFFEEEKRLVR